MASDPMIRIFPSIIPVDGFKLWEGFISFKGDIFIDYFISLKTPNFPYANGLQFTCSHGLQKLVSPHMTSVKKCKTVVDFIHSITQIMNTKLSMMAREKNKKFSRKDIDFIGYVADNIMQEEHCNNMIEDVDPTSGNLKLKYVDATGYTHYMVISIKYKFPISSLKVLEVDLPEEVVQSFPQPGTIAELYDAFISNINQLVPFWILMNKLAEESWVIEPEVVKKSHIHRRILVSDNLSIVLTFNPMKVHVFPDVQFLGSLHSVISTRMKYQQNIKAYGWCEELDLLENVKRLCEIDNFPLKPVGNVSEENTGKECYICFADMVDNHPPPSKWCSNIKCSSYYHLSCLLEWLTTIPTSTIMMDFISGPCPYCNQNLLCPYSNSSMG